MGQFDFLLNEPITWHDTGDSKWMWRARYRAYDLAVRLNDWPAEASYTVYVDGAAAYDIEEWPAAWTQVRKSGPARGASGPIVPPQG